AETKTYQKSQPKKSASVIYFQNLPQSIRTLILSKQKESGADFYKVKIESVLPKYFFVSTLLFGFFVLISMSHGPLWGPPGNFLILIASCTGAVFLSQKLLWIYNWHKSAVKCFFYITPLFFIKTYLDEIRYWWGWDIVNLNTIDHYKNGRYQKTSVKITFKDSSETIIFSSQAELIKFYHAMKETEDARLQAAAKHDWAWFNEHDIFHGITGRSSQDIQIREKRQKIISFSLAGAAIIIGGIFYINIYSINQVHNSEAIQRYANRQPLPESAPAPIPESAPAPQVFDKPPKSLPQNRYLNRYSSKKPIAPLAIMVPTGGSHYFVKIVDATTSRAIATVFIRSGHSVELEVPLGAYVLKYAMGTTWYGTKYLFGPATTAAKADTTLVFRIEGDKVIGHKVELIEQNGGNLSYSNISLEDF